MFYENEMYTYEEDDKELVKKKVKRGRARTSLQNNGERSSQEDSYTASPKNNLFIFESGNLQERIGNY